MPRWLWFLPLAALVLAIGLWAFRLGWIAATLTETDVIMAYSARYLEEHAGPVRQTDCSAQPATIESVWIIVTCIAGDGTRYDYPVDRFGQLVQVNLPERAPSEPRT